MKKSLYIILGGYLFFGVTCFGSRKQMEPTLTLLGYPDTSLSEVIEYREDLTIQAIKDLINDRWKIDPSRQTLLYQNKELSENTFSIKKYNIDLGRTIHVIIKEAPKVQESNDRSNALLSDQDGSGTDVKTDLTDPSGLQNRQDRPDIQEDTTGDGHLFVRMAATMLVVTGIAAITYVLVLSILGDNPKALKAKLQRKFQKIRKKRKLVRTPHQNKSVRKLDSRMQPDKSRVHA